MLGAGLIGLLAGTANAQTIPGTSIQDYSQDFSALTYGGNLNGQAGWQTHYTGDAWGVSANLLTGNHVHARSDSSAGSAAWGSNSPSDNAATQEGSTCGPATGRTQACEWSQFQFQVDYLNGDDDGGATDDGIGVVFGYEDNRNFWMFVMSENGGEIPASTGLATSTSNGNQSRLYHVENGVATVNQTATSTYAVNNLGRMSVLAYGGNVEIWLDNNLANGTTLTRVFQVAVTVDTGAVGLYCFADGSTGGVSELGCAFDNVAVRIADADNDGYGAQYDCDDADAAIHPNATEACDSIDNDCDGAIDDADSGVTGQSTWYADLDSDSFGNPSSSVQACTQPAQYVSNRTDCDDTRASVNPNANEVCDAADLDEDCDGRADDADLQGASGKTNWYADLDSDTYGSGAAVSACDAPLGRVADNTDCNDLNPLIHPNATEVCDLLNVDDDCDGAADEAGASGETRWYPDGDSDTYGGGTGSLACDAPFGNVSRGGDCNDGNAAVNPAAAEVCNGFDDDCDGLTDDADTGVGGQTTWYADADGDTYGGGVAQARCTQPSNTANRSGDCNDGNAAVNPGATEVCDNANTDEDCDGLADDNDLSATGKSSFHADLDSDTFGAGVGFLACDASSGFVANDADCDDLDNAVHPGAPELCNNEDDDCDGLVDGNDPDFTGGADWYPDADGDGFGDGSATPTQSCTPIVGSVANGSDCDDGDAAVNPVAIEVCDAGDTDEDCDGLADDPSAFGQSLWFEDGDGDGWGSVAAISACDAPSGTTAISGDCDDGNAGVNPAATEVCDASNVDEDCDGLADDLDLSAQGQTDWRFDGDGDGYGGPMVVPACERPFGTVADDTDCDDTVSSVHPGAPEWCNQRDDDCNGTVDDVSGIYWYADADGDGFGDAGAVTSACDQPSGFVDDAQDCDDADPAINPDGAEICDAADADEDCDGLADDADADVTGQGTFHTDADGDGFGDAGSSVQACDPLTGELDDDTDCDDGDAAVNPDALEVCNAIDDDCDGLVDDDDTVSGGPAWYLDEDGDGFAGSASVQACTQPADTYALVTDCDDADATINPSGAEVCDDADADEDCDGAADDADAGGATGGQGPLHPDLDADGYGDALGVPLFLCDPGTGLSTDGTDCDDARATVNPGADEVCDAADRDEDCDGLADDDDTGAIGGVDSYTDADADGYGDSATLVTTCESAGAAYGGDCDDADPLYHPSAAEGCADPDYNCDGFTGNTDNDGDGFDACAECDDGDALVNPAATEVCNGIDDDCDASVDDGAVDAAAWYADADADGYGDAGAETVSCSPPGGSVDNPDDCDDLEPTVNPGAIELCNGIDDDCDATVDEDPSFGQDAWPDGDGDGYGDPAGQVVVCTVPTGFVGEGTDCDDAVATTNPGGIELCNDVDDDCDGAIDDGATDLRDLHPDADADGYGDSASTVLGCSAGGGLVDDGTDCADADATINPAAAEICDGVDQDCDGLVDDGAGGTGTWFADADGDGWGDGAAVVACVQPVDTAEYDGDCDDADPAVHPSAVEDCSAAVDLNCDGFAGSGDNDGDGFAACLDCDDGDPAYNPAALEVCDDRDGDCDGSVDEGAVDAPEWYADVDGDGFGEGLPTLDCDAPAGAVADGTDCDDADADVFPGAVEECTDLVDVDCDGVVPGADGDGDGVAACLDCDDADDAVFPGAAELCDGLDNDCEGSVDVGAVDATLWFTDADGDGFGDPDSGVLACDGLVANGGDCDDTEAGVNPGAEEIVGDGIDQDCDGEDLVDTGETGDTGDTDLVDTDDTDVVETDVPDTDVPDTDGLDTDRDGIYKGGCGGCSQGSGSAGWIGALLAFGAVLRRKTRVA